MKHLFFIIVIFSIGIPNSIFSQDWKKSVEKKGIQVFTRQIKGYSLKDTRSEMYVRCSIEKFLTQIRSYETYPKWVSKCSSNKVIRRLNDTEVIYHTQLKIPFIHNRDMVIHYKEIKINENLYKIELKGLKDYLPEVEHFVRIPRFTGSWTVAKIDQNKLMVINENSYDPGGRIPDFLVNFAASETPLETFDELRKLLEN